MPGHRGVATLLLLGVLSVTLGGQTPERYRARLSIVPVDFSTLPTTSGNGEATAELRDDELRIDISFAGLHSPAAGIEVRRAERARRGEVVFDLPIGGAAATTGDWQESITLTDAQRADLRSSRYYIQIRTTGNPDGEIRGWLLPRE